MKKGQVSIIVIVAIVIAILIGMTFLQVKYQLFYKPPEKDPISDKLANSFSMFVENCLEMTGKEAFDKLGKTGGYIDFPRNTRFDVGGYDGDVYFENPNYVAYWHYVNKNDESASYMPPLCKDGEYCMGYMTGENSIQEQVENYIDENIRECFNNFESMRDVMIIDEVGELKTSVLFERGNVVLKLNFPVKVKNAANDDYTNVNLYEENLDLDFADIYDAAYELTFFESNSSMFERKTLGLMSLYEGLDAEKNIPPSHDVQFFMSDKMPIWSLYGVKETLENDILTYVNFFQAYNSNNYELVPVAPNEFRDEMIGIYGGMVFDFSPKRYDLDIDFEYNYDSIYLNINNNYILKGIEFKSEKQDLNPANAMISAIIGTMLKRYDFYYDITYPLKVDFNDRKAYNGDGYEFSVAYEVNIENNKPMVESSNFGNYTNNGLSFEFVTGASLVDREIRVNVFDKHTRERINDVDVFYRCPQEEFVGTTESVGDLSYATFKLPYCPVGGRLVFRHSDYMDNSIVFTNDDLENNPDTFVNKDVELWPIKEKDFKVLKRTALDLENFDPSDWDGYYDYLTELENKEMVYVTISRIKSNPFEQDIPLIGMLVFKNENTSIVKEGVDNQLELLEIALKEESITEEDYVDWKYRLERVDVNDSSNVDLNKVGLVPGNYTIEGFLVDNQKFTIPKKNIEVCKGVCLGDTNDFGECSSCAGITENGETLEAQNFSSFVTGQFKHDVSFSETEIYEYDSYFQIIMYELTTPQSWDDFMDWQDPLSYQIEKDTNADYSWRRNG
jgi:hypothetical protein